MEMIELLQYEIGRLNDRIRDMNENLIKLERVIDRLVDVFEHAETDKSNRHA